MATLIDGRTYGGFTAEQSEEMSNLIQTICREPDDKRAVILIDILRETFGDVTADSTRRTRNFIKRQYGIPRKVKV